MGPQVTEKMTQRPGLFLAAILVLGFALRAAGIQFGLPHLYHADEPIVVNHALAFGAGDLNPHFFKIPPLVSYLLFFCYGIFFVIGKITGAFTDAASFETFFYSDPSAFFLIARAIFGVLTGTACIAVFFSVFRFSQRAALTGAFLLAVCFLHVRDSHYVYADIPLNLATLAAFGIFFRLQASPSFKNHLISGAFIGLAAALKYNGAALVLPYMTASLLSQKKGDIKGWFAAAGAAVVLFLALNPYSLLDFKFFITELRNQSASNTGTPWYHHLTYSLTGGMGLPLLATGLAGLVWAIIKGRPEHKILAVFTLGYYLVLVQAGQPYDRYVIPLLPPLIFLAADFTVRFFRPASFFAFWIALMAVPNLAKSVLFDKIMLADDVRTQGMNWIKKNVPAGSAIALDWEFYMPRLSFSNDQLEEKKAKAAGNQQRKLEFLLSRPAEKSYRLYFMVTDPDKPRFLFGEPAMPYNLTMMKDRRIDYVFRLAIPQKQETEDFFQAIREHEQLAASFTPYRSGRMLPYDNQPLTGGPFTWKELLDRERNGLAFEIYKIGK